MLIPHQSQEEQEWIHSLQFPWLMDHWKPQLLPQFTEVSWRLYKGAFQGQHLGNVTEGGSTHPVPLGRTAHLFNTNVYCVLRDFIFPIYFLGIFPDKWVGGWILKYDLITDIFLDFWVSGIAYLLLPCTLCACKVVIWFWLTWYIGKIKKKDDHKTAFHLALTKNLPFTATYQVLCGLLNEIVTTRYNQETPLFFSHCWSATSKLPVPSLDKSSGNSPPLSFALSKTHS